MTIISHNWVMSVFQPWRIKLYYPSSKLVRFILCFRSTFEIISLINLNFGFFDLSFTNANLFCIFAIFFCLVGFQVISVNNKGYFVPTRLQVIYEGLYVFILNIVN